MQENETITFEDLTKTIEEMGSDEIIIEVPLGGDDDAGK